MILQWVNLGFIGSMRTTTFLTAIVLFAFLVWRTRKPWTALVSVIAWASLYEILWYLTGVVVHQFSWTHAFWLTGALVAWPVLAHVQGVRPNRWLFVAFAVAWSLWMLSGFHFNDLNAQRPFDFIAEFLNVLTKTLLAIAYASQKSVEPTRQRNA